MEHPRGASLLVSVMGLLLDLAIFQIFSVLYVIIYNRNNNAFHTIIVQKSNNIAFKLISDINMYNKQQKISKK